MKQHPTTPDRRARGRPRDWDDKTSQNTIKSLDRAIDVLERLGAAGGSTLSALAGDLGQSPATVYRVLVTLETRRLVEFDPEGQIWQIGAGAFLIGARFLRRTALVDRARPILRALMEQTGETANLGVETEGQVLFVSQVETHASIRAFFPPGTLSPMHASGIGKALLAQMPPGRLARVLDAHPPERFTAQTLTDRAALEADLVATRARGFSIDAEERNEGMCCVAAPVFDLHGDPVAGLSVSGPTTRVRAADMDRLGGEVRRAAATLSGALGGAPVDGSSFVSTVSASPVSSSSG
ncbi:IclR family transcriptional regulator [Meridianimarinicoccus roseus]|jgi:IclR family acetate operon transcriptional repressor|uniref:IclR family transcriptional regulator n=1 Tax=Meridianimarinicoccus roseus TaxID=2072018 RepID=A0A2V2LB06_9RHOB|nr:HTH-type transcriptional regulator BhcR [Meridianimarinicoccus roseus]PWR02445.1 IclR family transcriptional regulator [Meridianimarinicoccus roseus]